VHTRPSIKVLSVTLVFATALGGVLLGSRWAPGDRAVALEPAVGEGLSPLSERRVVTGWIPYYDLEEGIASVTARPSVIAEVSAFWYRATEKSQVRPMAGNWHPEADLISAIDELHASGVAVLATVKDDGFNGPEMWRLLSSQQRRNALVTEVTTMVERTGADGAEIDFEGMNFVGTAKQRTGIKRLFPIFLERLQERLHQENALLSVALPPRRSASDPFWEVIDYDAIGKVVDRAKVMTYDYHVPAGNPGPIGPYGWTREVVEHAKRQFRAVPISIGTMAQGYNWYVKTLRGQCPNSVKGPTVPTHGQVLDLANDYNAKVQWSRDAREYHYDYRRPYSEYGNCVTLRRVWFGDARSANERLLLAKRLGVQGIAVWPFGFEDSRLWARARDVAESIKPGTAKAGIGGATSVAPGESFEVTGRITVKGTPVVGEPVVLQKRVPGRSWGPVSETVTGADGRLTVLVSAQRTLDWRWKVPAGWDWQLSYSPPRRVVVSQP
jgi:spore germination protein YaaH